MTNEPTGNFVVASALSPSGQVVRDFIVHLELCPHLFPFP